MPKKSKKSKITEHTSKKSKRSIMNVGDFDSESEPDNNVESDTENEKYSKIVDKNRSKQDADRKEDEAHKQILIKINEATRRLEEEKSLIDAEKERVFQAIRYQQMQQKQMVSMQASVQQQQPQPQPQPPQPQLQSQPTELKDNTANSICSRHKCGLCYSVQFHAEDAAKLRVLQKTVLANFESFVNANLQNSMASVNQTELSKLDFFEKTLNILNQMRY